MGPNLLLSRRRVILWGGGIKVWQKTSNLGGLLILEEIPQEEK